MLAPETGDVRVRRPHRARRAAVGERQRKAAASTRWVKSGDDTEFRASIFLLAGRAYPIRLEFSKAKQGVDDTKKNPNPPPTTGVDRAALEAAEPRGRGDPGAVPHARRRSPEVAVIETPFPPDDRSFGWERGTTVSKEWDAATTDAAIEAADLRRRATARTRRRVRRTRRTAAPKLRDFARTVRRAGLPPAARHRGAAALHRPAVRGRAGRRPRASSGSCCSS